MRISDWSSDVCSSDLRRREDARHLRHFPAQAGADRAGACQRHRLSLAVARPDRRVAPVPTPGRAVDGGRVARSEEHTSELQSLMRISYAVFCLKKTRTAHLIYTSLPASGSQSTKTLRIPLVTHYV